MWPSAAAHISAVVFWNPSAVFTSAPRASSWRTAGTLPARAAASSGVSPSGWARVGLAPDLQEQVHHRGVAAAARVEQRRDAEVVGGIDGGAGGDERAGDVEVRAVGRPQQRSRPVAGRGVDVGARLEERADDLEISGFHRLDERAVAAGASHGHEDQRRREGMPRMRARREPSEPLLRRVPFRLSRGRLEAPLFRRAKEYTIRRKTVLQLAKTGGIFVIPSPGPRGPFP